jgi:hypothetical protein
MVYARLHRTFLTGVIPCPAALASRYRMFHFTSSSVATTTKPASSLMRRFYLHWLTEHAGDTGCRVHAYVLMTNHVHLLVTAKRDLAGGTFPILPHSGKGLFAALPALY